MATPTYGYDVGQPFGDPNRFTRGTQQTEIDRFNDWMRQQPWWQQIRGTTQGDFTDRQAAALVQTLAAHGIQVPKDFHIDEGGNFNQTSRVKRNLLIAGAIGGAALGGLGLAGIGPLAGGGGAAAGSAGTAAATGGSTAAGSTALASVVSPKWWSAAWLPTAISGGVQAAGNIYASRTAASANRDAAQLEYEATQQALADARAQREYEQKRDEEQQQYERGRYAEERDYTRGIYGEERDYGRGQYANYLGRLDPYAKAGTRATARLEDILTQSRPMNPAAGPAASGGTVRLKAPTGEVRDVPVAMAESYLNRGAVRV